MIVVRIIGYILLLSALAAAGAEILQSMEAGYWDKVQVGDIWAAIDHHSLQQTQVGLERYVDPFLWDPILLNIVLAPAWLILGVPGLLLILLARRSRRPRMFS